ncbi:elongation factor G [Occallatibacter riparius]|uniref:Elongation factor G n=1 Tax=Occallatibacter riparius TaxID=1002689 RepID=A0A9J7BRH3_9BACT|nr:elongation factor G [Occallatibacter riparius]UWZ84362.1 elongation factor G [Occallatibacter riparius]
MKTYQGSEIRNVAVVGHAHSGKTTLIAALLHAAKMTPAQGRVHDGSAVTAYDEEEVARGTTMQNAVAFAEWQGTKINFVDTPGFHMFCHEARAALLPVESVAVVVNAQNCVEPVTERVWKYAEEANVPRIVVINQMDHPKAGGEGGLTALIEDLHERWGRTCTPVQLPIVDAKGFQGVVDLVTMEAFYYTPNGDGRGKIGEIPATLAHAAKEAHEALVELVAEGKDELMEEFFAEGTIPEQHLITALHEAIREDRIFPVLFASGETNVATDHLLDFFKVYAPAPIERAPIAVRTPALAAAANGNGGSADAAEAATATRAVSDSEPAALLVFKTMSDPFAGRISFFKVVSGCVKNDATLENYSRRGQEKFSHLSVMQGRKAVEIPELHAGDIGAVAKLKDTLTGDTLGVKGSDILVDLHPLPEPAMTYAIEPKSRADEDKLAPAIHKLMEEDLLIRFYRDPQTNEFLIAGAGQPHIEAIVSRLKKRYHAEVTLKSPKVPYLETIRAKGEAHGRHKKQSGGHGQFGDCKIRMEPQPRGGGFEFASEVFGGAIPRQFIPAIEKGVIEAAARGYLAGYPVVDFKVIVYDGSYHDVDSNEMSFKTAGRLAFKKAMEVCKPALLEPIMKVEIEAPDEFAGAIMGDLSSRRGRPQGMNSKGKTTVVNAEVPMAEMLTYGTQLTSMTQGKGSYRMEMDHYDFVPQIVADKILSNAKRPVDEEEE